MAKEQKGSVLLAIARLGAMAFVGYLVYLDVKWVAGGVVVVLLGYIEYNAMVSAQLKSDNKELMNMFGIIMSWQRKHDVQHGNDLNEGSVSSLKNRGGMRELKKFNDEVINPVTRAECGNCEECEPDDCIH